MGKPYTYLYRDRGYSRRHRTYEMEGDNKITALVTRYTYQSFYKPAQGPRGGKARKQCMRSVYYKAGTFYRACNVQREDGTYYNSLKPFEGVIWDCHPGTSEKQGVPVVTIECVEGVPVSVRTEDGTEIWAWGVNEIAELEDLLWIPEQDRATEGTEEVTEETTTNNNTEETTSVTTWEDERDAWILATTTTGQQLDLIAWAGYGDATWQDIAA